MGFRTRFDAASTVELVLACDPAVVETNTTEALDRYRLDGDSGRLNIPDEAVRVKVRPLTPEARREAYTKAGRPSQRGRRVEARKDKDPKLKEARKALGLVQAQALLIKTQIAEPETTAQKRKELSAEMLKLTVDMGDAIDALEDAEAEWVDALSDADAEALRRWHLFQNDRMDALVAECLVEWRDHKDADPDPVLLERGGLAFLRTLKPSDRGKVCAELAFHIHKISELGEEGKARFERGLGSARPSASAQPHTGTATPASSDPSSTSEEPAEAPSSEG